MNEIEELLRGEIETELDGLSDLKLGEKDHQTAIEGLAKLADKMIEIEKVSIDHDEKAKTREETKAQREFENDLKKQQLELEKDLKKQQLELEKDLKKQQLELEKEKVKLEIDLKREQIEEDRKDRFIRNCISIAGIIIPTLVTIWGTKKSFEFEKEGTITTIMGRGFINKLLPKK
jgi:hypothetical protein